MSARLSATKSCFAKLTTGAILPHGDYVFYTMANRKQFVVTCKVCHKDVPSGMKEFPSRSIAVTCSSCGGERQYLPSEVFLGRPYRSDVKRK